MELTPREDFTLATSIDLLDFTYNITAGNIITVSKRLLAF